MKAKTNIFLTESRKNKIIEITKKANIVRFGKVSAKPSKQELRVNRKKKLETTPNAKTSGPKNNA